MIPGSIRPRFGAGRGWSLLVAFVLLLLSAGAVAPTASASSTAGSAIGARATHDSLPATGAFDPYDPNNIRVAIRLAPLPFTSSPNHVTTDIVVTNKDGSTPNISYAVYLTFNEPGQDPIENPNVCAEEHSNSPDVPRGVYRCTQIIRGPGAWEFHGTVNVPGQNNQRVLKTISKTFSFPNAVKLKLNTLAFQYIVEGKTFEVFLLQFHVVMATLWLLLAASMAFMAIPRLRRTLSVLALHTLEVRRGFLVTNLWVTFIGTLGSGLYLLSTQTAYAAPYTATSFSHSAWVKITRLPYAQEYFLLLYTKILMFGVMAAASVVLVQEAARQAQLTQDAGAGDDDYIDLWAQGVHFNEDGSVMHEDAAVASAAAGGVLTRTATALRARRQSTVGEGTTLRTLWVCLGIMLIGAGSIGVCVTGLKYLHELIESTVAATVLGGGG